LRANITISKDSITTKRLSNELAVYLSDEYDISKTLSVNYGVRLPVFTAGGKTYSAFEPRITTKVSEYKDVSPWYGTAGYAAAITTAYFRMYNNRHWFRDLLPGAGIGIISTRVAYWIYPAIKRKLFMHKQMNTLGMPAYQNGSFGVGLVHRF